MRASEVVGGGGSVGRGLREKREGESEEEMDGGGKRDVRKQRAEGVFYGAIGKEANDRKEG